MSHCSMANSTEVPQYRSFISRKGWGEQKGALGICAARGKRKVVNRDGRQFCRCLERPSFLALRNAHAGGVWLVSRAIGPSVLTCPRGVSASGYFCPTFAQHPCCCNANCACGCIARGVLCSEIAEDIVAHVLALGLVSTECLRRNRQKAQQLMNAQTFATPGCHRQGCQVCDPDLAHCLRLPVESRGRSSTNLGRPREHLCAHRLQSCGASWPLEGVVL